MFLKIDLRLGCHQVKIKEESIIKSHSGQDMATCTNNFNVSNNVFSKHLDKFVLVFLDGILVYSKNEEEREENLKLLF